MQIALACVLVVCVGHLWSTAIDLSGPGARISGLCGERRRGLRGPESPAADRGHVLVGPAAEELIFRGMIYRRAENYFRTGWAVGISSALFGIYHGNVIQFLYAAVLGILLAVIYEKSRTLLAPVLAHMAVNLWAIYSGDCIRGLSLSDGRRGDDCADRRGGRGGGCAWQRWCEGSGSVPERGKREYNICEGL